MTYTELPVTFDCRGETLVGILSRPESPQEIGVVIPVGGPQYRAGSHRQFALLARHLASEGYAVLRFDYRGMGDSTGTQIQFEASGPDIAAAIDNSFVNIPALQRVVLWGLCDAASASLLYWHDSRDPRIAGFCLLNPWVRTEASLAKTHVKHYYLQRLASREFWKKLLSGGIPVGNALTEAAGKVRKTIGSPERLASRGQPAFQERMGESVQQFDGPVLLILSEKDLTAKEFEDYSATSPRWQKALAKPGITIRRETEADHTFSTKEWRNAVEMATANLLRGTHLQKNENQEGSA